MHASRKWTVILQHLTFTPSAASGDSFYEKHDRSPWQFISNHAPLPLISFFGKAAEGYNIMSTEEFKLITFEDGSCAVVRVDPNQPRFMEVLATFYDLARARDYARFESSRRQERREERTEPERHEPPEETVTAEEKGMPAGLTERQQALLSALRAKMDESNLVEARARALAEATDIPLGSIHSVLSALEKMNLIRTKRAGSMRNAAVYEVLDPRGTGGVNGEDQRGQPK